MRAVHMRVEAGTRLQLEHAVAFVEGPDSGEGGAQMRDERARRTAARAWASESVSVSDRPTAAPSAESCARWRVSSSARLRAVRSCLTEMKWLISPCSSRSGVMVCSSV